MFKRLGLFLICVSLASCAKTSSDPQIEELIKTRAPTFDGLAAKTYIVPSSFNTISGECDPISKGLEYSFDNSTWVTFNSGCTTGTFSVAVISTPRRLLYVRAKTKTGYTSSAIATVRLAIAPSSNSVAAVISSRTDEDDGTAGVTNAIHYNFTGDSSQSAAHIADFNIIGAAYGQ
jgi:hypothetical protein